MGKSALPVVSAALGLISYARAHRIDLGTPGAELLSAIESVMPGTVEGFDAICPKPKSGRRLPKLRKLRGDRFLNGIWQGPKVSPIKKVQGHTELVDHAEGRG